MLLKIFLVLAPTICCLQLAEILPSTLNIPFIFFLMHYMKSRSMLHYQVYTTASTEVTVKPVGSVIIKNRKIFPICF